MTLQQFKYLTLKEQEFVLQTQAVFLATIQDEKNVFNLFQVDGFYLEVHCNLTETIVRSLNYFEELSLLDPYLELINIEFIYQLPGYGRLH